VAVSSEARVYSVGGAVYGCSPGSSRHYRLGNTGSCINSTRVGPVAAASNLAAYASTSCGVDTGSTQVIVRRLSDGRQLSSHPATTGLIAPESYQSVGSIVVDGSGHAAWIGSLSSIVRHGQETQVNAAGSSGVKVLATGSDIQVNSLKLHGSTLTWTAGGKQHSATLG
jgi:hypothetical protein